MMKHVTHRLLQLLLILICQTTSFVTFAETLVIGSISSRPASEIKRFQPLVNYLSEALRPVGIDKVKLHIAGGIDEMTSLMLSGKVSVYLDSPFPSLTLSQAGASDIVLRRWKKGVKEYNSVIFVRKDSGIETLSDLNGKMIVFEEEFSTSSYYIPKASMQQQGLILKEKSDRFAKLADNEVGYLFSGDDRNTVTWVRKNRVSAGAINNIKYKGLKDSFKQQLKIIFHSISVPRQVVNFSIKLSPKNAEAIKIALLNMDKNIKGREQLMAFEKTAKFDEFPIPVDRTMAPLKKLAKVFK